MKTLRLVLLTSVCLVGSAMAQSMNIDLGKLPPEVAASVLKAEQERKGGVQLPTTAEEAEKYAKVGEQVAKAVSATAKGLSIEVNEFVKTPVGWWTFIFVFWYFLGAKLWHIVGGTLFFAITSIIAWKSFKTFFITQHVISEKNGEKKYGPYEFNSGDAKVMSAIAHIAIAAAITITSLVLIF